MPATTVSGRLIPFRVCVRNLLAERRVTGSEPATWSAGEHGSVQLRLSDTSVRVRYNSLQKNSLESDRVFGHYGGYTRIRGALANLGHDVARGTIANILKQHGIEPAPERCKKTTWQQFLQAHWEALAAADFFTVEVWTRSGLVRVMVLFVIELSTRQVEIAGICPQPDGAWMTQISRNLTDDVDGFLVGKKHLIHDRDPLFTPEFRETLAAAGVRTVRLPARSPNLNAYAERFVRSIKESCLDRMIFFGERSLGRAVQEFVAHYHFERNHQGLDNELIFPERSAAKSGAPIECRQRLGGMLKYYHRQAA